MTCRHRPGDPECSSSPQGSARRASEAATSARQEVEGKFAKEIAFLKSQIAATPDSRQYEILEAEEVGGNLVLKVKYPNCERCSYEGVKVMVYLGCSVKAALRWKIIDPHFRDPVIKLDAKTAPGPDARFPGSQQGWQHALWYAQHVYDGDARKAKGSS
jgi:hypothetical protein